MIKPSDNLIIIRATDDDDGLILDFNGPVWTPVIAKGMVREYRHKGLDISGYTINGSPADPILN